MVNAAVHSQVVAHCLGGQRGRDLRVVNRPHHLGMAQVVGLKLSPRTPERLTHQCPDITVAVLGVEGRQSLGAKGLALDPLG